MTTLGDPLRSLIVDLHVCKGKQPILLSTTQTITHSRPIQAWAPGSPHHTKTPPGPKTPSSTCETAWPPPRSCCKKTTSRCRGSTTSASTTSTRSRRSASANTSKSLACGSSMKVLLARRCSSREGRLAVPVKRRRRATPTRHRGKS